MNLEDRQRYLIENNVNAGKIHDGKEFLILICGLVGLCLFIYIIAGIAANLFIDNMSVDTQLKIEKALSYQSNLTEKKPLKNYKNLENIKSKIIRMDKNLQGKSNFPLYYTSDKEINAFIMPDGTIYFTLGLLKEVKDEEILSFILAHELGHYSHRDHLKTISREILAGICLSVLSGGQKELSGTINSISGLTGFKYSREQEKNADLYANKIVYKLYGRNTGAVKFFKYLQTKENTPEFLYYFSTHPSTKKRLELIQK